MKTKPYLDCNFLRISNGRSICIFDARGDQIDYCTQHGCPIRDKSSDEFRVMDLQWADWEEVESDPDYDRVLSPSTSDIEWMISDWEDIKVNTDCYYYLNNETKKITRCGHAENKSSECTFSSCPIKVDEQTPKENKGESISEIAGKIARLVEEKQIAYGNSFNLSGEVLKLLYPNGVQPAQYSDMLCVVRIIDKLFRIASQKEAFEENPYNDIVGYGLLGAKYL